MIPKGISVVIERDWGHITWNPISARGGSSRLADFEGLVWYAGFEGLTWGGVLPFGGLSWYCWMRGVDVYPPLALRRFGVILLNHVYFAPCVYPPLRGVCDFVENPYMIFDVYITIISGRNKYLKISESRKMCLPSQDIQGRYLETWREREGSVKGVKAKNKLSKNL
jgi:hypothetical protein